MKLRTVLLFAGLAAVHLTSAQVRTGPRIGLGLATQSVGGFFQNMSNLLPRPIFGWAWEIHVHPQVIIQPEITLVSKGFTNRNPELATRDRAVFKFIEVPLMAMFQTDQSVDGLFVSAGLVTGYKVSGKYTQWTNGDVTQDIKYDLSGTSNRWDFGPAVGLGVVWHEWTFEARAQTSLALTEPMVQVRNILYGFNFTYLFTPKSQKG
ncbi:MAG: PorT family protein [Flavobacteriales bacterium]|nr:PorT family protein [Flavobacteriales bacterium]